MRHKAFYTTISVPAMKFVVDFVIGCASEKMSKRVHIARSLNHFEKLDKSILPQEYGGSIPMKVMIEMCKRELDEKRELLMSHDLMMTREECYSGSILHGSAKSLRTSIASQIESQGTKKGMSNGFTSVQGSFRKLEID